MQDIDVGDFKDKNIPLIFCARFITKNFLLSGTPNNLIPDKTVRVSVKSLALACLATIFEIYPHVLLKYLDKQKPTQQLSDVFYYATHSDPQLRGAVRILIATFIKAALIDSSGSYDDFVGKNVAVNDCDVFQMERLLDVFLKVI